MNMLKKLLQLENIPHYIFFGFATLGLFLGDGKQNVIDIWMGIGIGFLYFYAFFINPQLKSLPKSINVAWLLFIGYCVIRTLFSDSVGLSITQTIRYAQGYLIFQFFYSYSSLKFISRFIKGLFVFTLFTIFTSFFLFIFPNFGYQLPSMNLLFAAFGHNHIVAILFFAFPIVLHRFLEKPTLSSSSLLILFLTSFALSFSRASWIILLGYFLWVLVRRIKESRLVSLSLLSIGFLFTCLLVSQIILFTHDNKYEFIPPLIRKQLIKNPNILGSRLEYWNQAFQAFKQNPAFGSGPGTFYLSSLRYQSKPNSYSYFAHNFLLEMLSETGIVGIMFLGFLIFILIKNIDHTKLKKYHYIFSGIILTVIFSFLDFNLSFLIIFLLLLAFLAMLLRKSQNSKSSSLKRNYVFLFIILTYCICSLLSSMLVNSSSKYGIYISPFDRYSVLSYIRKNSQNNEALQTALQYSYIFHRKDAEINYKFFELYMNKNSNIGIFYLKNAIKYDPKNIQYQKSYLAHNLLSYDKKELIADFFKFSKNNLPDNKRLDLDSLLNDKSIEKISDNTLAQIFTTMENPYDLFLAKALYFIGHDLINYYPETTLSAWKISLVLNPQLSFYPAELASFHYYRNNDLLSAKSILQDCSIFLSTRMHCNDLLENINEPGYLPIPGYYFKDIKNYKYD